jgi:hypothetical protein
MANAETMTYGKQAQARAQTSYSCPSCGGGEQISFHDLENVPVHSVLNIATREEALEFPRGSIELSLCRRCGFVANRRFDPAALHYTTGYEATQSYSPTFNAFARRLAARLVDRHDLHGKTLLEIGCGNGEFLDLICSLGDNRGIGFDPAYLEQRSPCREKDNISIIKDFYSPKYSEWKADFLFCRMTLEHIPDVANFVGMVRETLAEDRDTTVFFQVPDLTRILQDCAFEDIYYEHCSYFSPHSLASLFQRSGFSVTSVERDYGGQYIMIEAFAGERGIAVEYPREESQRLLESAEGFAERFGRKKSEWRRRLAGYREQGMKVVLWGAGSKAVSFLTSLDGADAIEYAVDINPHRQGKFMAATAQQIASPEFLRDYRPDVVIIMNEVYRDEISGQLGEMGLTPKILTLA